MEDLICNIIEALDLIIRITNTHTATSSIVSTDEGEVSFCLGEY